MKCLQEFDFYDKIYLLEVGESFWIEMFLYQ